MLNNIFSEEAFQDKRLDIKISNNNNPLGFGANHNKTFNNVDCDYFIVVNPDIYFNEPFDLDKFIELHKSIDILSPIQKGVNGEKLNFIRRDLSFINFVKKIFFYETCNYHDFDWICGAFLSFTSKSYNVLDGFDPGFKMYIEDCDICYRARSKNYNLAIAEDFNVIHIIGGMSKKNLQHFIWHVSSLLRYWYLKIFRI